MFSFCVEQSSFNSNSLCRGSASVVLPSKNVHGLPRTLREDVRFQLKDTTTAKQSILSCLLHSALSRQTSRRDWARILFFCERYLTCKNTVGDVSEAHPWCKCFWHTFAFTLQNHCRRGAHWELGAAEENTEELSESVTIEPTMLTLVEDSRVRLVSTLQGEKEWRSRRGEVWRKAKNTLITCSSQSRKCQLPRGCAASS